MIKKLRIENLQSHVDSELEFHPGVNLITGESDVGKSAVIRAIRWLTLNKPTGSGLRRHKTKQTKVRMDGVTKMRSASKHQYEADDMVFKALRSSVPDHIKDKINLSEVNFQLQHDTYFLIADSPGQVAQTLNEVADLQMIDLSIKEVKHRLKLLKSEGKFLVEQQNSQESKITELQWVKEADDLYKRVEKLQESVDSFIKMIKGIDGQVFTCINQRESLLKLPETGQDMKSLCAVEVSVSDIQPDLLAGAISKVEDNKVVIPYCPEDLNKLLSLKSSIEDKTLETVTKSMDQALTHRMKLEEFPQEFEDPSEALDLLLAVGKRQAALEEGLNEVLISEDCLEYADNEHAQAQEEMAVKMSELGICPCCGGKI